MAQLWTWNIATSEEKQITKGDFTVSDPRWSPDDSHITFTTTPTPLLDDLASLQTAWVLDATSGAEPNVGRYTGQHAHGPVVPAMADVDRVFE